MKKYLRLFTLAVALIFASSAIAPTESHATMYSSSVVASGSASTPWVPILVFVGVASIISCAVIVGSHTGRELTLEQAVHAGIVPLHCLWDGALDE
jgi:predicted RNA-binding protein